MNEKNPRTEAGKHMARGVENDDAKAALAAGTRSAQGARAQMSDVELADAIEKELRGAIIAAPPADQHRPSHPQVRRGERFRRDTNSIER